MKTLGIVWYLLSKWLRANIDGLIDAVKDEKASRVNRIAQRDLINQSIADTKRRQDECPHRRVNGSSCVVPFGEPVIRMYGLDFESRQESAVCQYCQKVWTRPDDPELFDRIVAGYSINLQPTGEPVTAEEERLYAMPLEELQKLATA